MDSDRVGALFFHAVEDLVCANDLVITLQLREALDANAVRAAYAEQVRARPTLRSALQLDPVRSGHGWEVVDDQTLEELLEQQLLTMACNQPTPFAESLATNAGLPYRVRLLEPRRLEVRISHLLTNGQGALFWADDLLGVLNGELGDLAPAPPGPGRVSRALSVVRETTWSLAWVASFLARAGRDAASQTVDLSDGQPGLPMGGGFTSMVSVLSTEETHALAAHAREHGRRMTSLLLSCLAAELLDARPDKTQACIVMPDDLLAARPGVARWQPGNHTGALVARLNRSQRDDLPAQADKALRWSGRGVASGTTRLADLAVRDERRLREQLRAGVAKPLTDRGPFESASCVLSNVGARREFSRLSEACEWVSVTSFGQPPILTALDVSGRVAFELTASLDLFDRVEMQRLFDGFIGRLVSSLTP